VSDIDRLIKPDYLATVCSRCRCASCWHGVFMCMDSRCASTVDVPASVLRAEDREHPSNFSRAALLRICGVVREVSA
jgi:hypothetical protein